MKTMPFPKEYKRTLKHKKKNVTIRIQQEVGKYKRGHVYQATDYKGNPFNIEIKILDVFKMPLSKIKKYVPEINRPEFKKLPKNAKVDIIKFISRSTKPDLVDISNYGLKAEEGKIKLNKEAAKALQKANNELPNGYNLIVINGFRSPEEQLKIVKNMEKKLKKTHPHSWESLLNKYTGGYEELKQIPSFMDHRSGNAVDVKITHNNEEINLGDQKNDERDRLDYYENNTNQIIKHNRRWLKFILEKHGFKNNPNEWWHWGFKPKW